MPTRFYDKEKKRIYDKLYHETNKEWIRKRGLEYRSKHKTNKQEYDRKHLRLYKARRRIITENSKLWVDLYKSTHGCKHCGELHPACLDFHHLNPINKKVKVSKLANHGNSKQTVLAEIRKCILLCANCHRKKHYSRLSTLPLFSSK